MSCLGVHFALTEVEVKQLRSLKGEARIDYVQEVIEEDYFSEHPDLKAESDKSWDAMHRALSGGQLNWNGGQYPLNHTVLGRESLYSGSNYILSLKSPQQVHDIAAALSGISEEEFRMRYTAIDPKSYGVSLSEDDFRYTWEYFQEVRDLYTRASRAGRFVLFSADQ